MKCWLVYTDELTFPIISKERERERERESKKGKLRAEWLMNAFKTSIFDKRKKKLENGNRLFAVEGVQLMSQY